MRISEIIQPNLMRKCNYLQFGKLVCKFVQFDCDKQVIMKVFATSQEVIVYVLRQQTYLFSVLLNVIKSTVVDKGLKTLHKTLLGCQREKMQNFINYFLQVFH